LIVADKGAGVEHQALEGSRSASAVGVSRMVRRFVGDLGKMRGALFILNASDIAK
jgi:hypothetical protein